MLKEILAGMAGAVVGATVVHFAKEENRDKAKEKISSAAENMKTWALEHMPEEKLQELAKKLAEQTGQKVEDILAQLKTKINQKKE